MASAAPSALARVRLARLAGCACLLPAKSLVLIDGWVPSQPQKADLGSGPVANLEL